MKIPKNYFNNLPASKYREYLKLLPNMQKENTRIITTLILTFFAMSFFGIFAINPTLSTIVTLQKQLADSELVYEKLKTKITTLSSLQQQYANLQADLPVVMEAIPKIPDAPLLTAQIHGLAKQRNIKITSFSISGVQLKEANIHQPKQTASPAPDTAAAALLSELPIAPGADTPNSVEPGENPLPETSYAFSLQFQGSYDELMAFAKSLSQMNRIITIDSISINKDTKQSGLTMAINARVYFQK